MRQLTTDSHKKKRLSFFSWYTGGIDFALHRQAAGLTPRRAQAPASSDSRTNPQRTPGRRCRCRRTPPPEFESPTALPDCIPHVPWFTSVGFGWQAAAHGSGPPALVAAALLHSLWTAALLLHLFKPGSGCCSRRAVKPRVCVTARATSARLLGAGMGAWPRGGCCGWGRCCMPQTPGSAATGCGRRPTGWRPGPAPHAWLSTLSGVRTSVGVLPTCRCGFTSPGTDAGAGRCVRAVNTRGRGGDAWQPSPAVQISCRRSKGHSKRVVRGEGRLRWRPCSLAARLNERSAR